MLSFLILFEIMKILFTAAIIWIYAVITIKTVSAAFEVIFTKEK